MFDLLLDKAIENFLRDNIDEAKKGFESCLMLKPDDKLAMLCYTIADLPQEGLENSKSLMRYAAVADDDEIDGLLSYIFDENERRIESNNGFSTSWTPEAESKITKRIKDDLETAVKIDPGFSEAELFLGKIYRKMGDYGTAVEHLQKSLLINPFELEAVNEIETLITEYDKKPGRKEET